MVQARQIIENIKRGQTDIQEFLQIEFKYTYSLHNLHKLNNLQTLQ